MYQLLIFKIRLESVTAVIEHIYENKLIFINTKYNFSPFINNIFFYVSLLYFEKQRYIKIDSKLCNSEQKRIFKILSY